MKCVLSTFQLSVFLLLFNESTQLSVFLKRYHPQSYARKATSDSGGRNRRSTQHNSIEILLRYYEKKFLLILHHDDSDTFANDVTLDVDGDSDDSTVLNYFFEGYLKDDAGSYAHGSIMDGVFDGWFVTGDGTTYYVERATKYKTTLPLTDTLSDSKFHSLVYSEHDVDETKVSLDATAPGAHSPSQVHFDTATPLAPPTRSKDNLRPMGRKHLQTFPAPSSISSPAAHGSHDPVAAALLLADSLSSSSTSLYLRRAAAAAAGRRKKSRGRRSKPHNNSHHHYRQKPHHKRFRDRLQARTEFSSNLDAERMLKPLERFRERTEPRKLLPHLHIDTESIQGQSVVSVNVPTLISPRTCGLGGTTQRIMEHLQRSATDSGRTKRDVSNNCKDNNCNNSDNNGNNAADSEDSAASAENKYFDEIPLSRLYASGNNRSFRHEPQRYLYSDDGETYFENPFDKYLHPDQQRARRKRDAAQYEKDTRGHYRVRSCSLYIQADQVLYSHIYNNEGQRDHQRTVEEIYALINNHIRAVKKIYEETPFNGITGITFRVQRVTIFTPKTCTTNAESEADSSEKNFNPFCKHSVDVSYYLNLNSKKDHSDFCLAYALTYRDFIGGTLGLAWVASPVPDTSGGIREVFKFLNEGSRRAKRSFKMGIMTGELQQSRAAKGFTFTDDNCPFHFMGKCHL